MSLKENLSELTNVAKVFETYWSKNPDSEFDIDIFVTYPGSESVDAHLFVRDGEFSLETF